jgi:hypothetical protein
MPLWRRKKPLHEQLASEGGMFEAPVESDRPPWDKAGIHGIPRPRRWDAVASAEAPELPGQGVHFVALPDGTLVVDEDVPDGALARLAEAIEAMLEPPYRAEGVRREDQVWAVGANAIDVLELSEEVEGDTIEVTVSGDQRTLLVDGAPAFVHGRELDQLAESPEFVARAQRLDGNLWEVEVEPL